MKYFSGRWTVAAVVAYVVWGLLHLGLGVGMVADGLAGGVESEVAAESLMFFVAACVFGGQAIAVALVLNRVNSRFGYWLNAVTLGVIDVAFLAIMVGPGHVDPIGGISGPIVWLVAVACSTAAMLSRESRHA